MLNRSTRRVAATDVGRALFERARVLLADLEEAEAEVGELQTEPRGPLRVGAPMDFGRRYLAEPLARFAADHPAVDLDIQLTDRLVDVVGEGFDLVVRIGRLPDSNLVARRLASCRRVLVASPAYLTARGTPREPADLVHHQRVGYSLENARSWALESDASKTGRERRPEMAPIPIERHRADNGEMVRALVRAGCGLAFLPTFLVGEDLRDGSLEEVLPGRLDADLAVHAITPHRKLLSAKVRLLLDHLRESLGANTTLERVDE